MIIIMKTIVDNRFIVSGIGVVICVNIEKDFSHLFSVLCNDYSFLLSFYNIK